jgi:phosphoribosylformylglycinamidine cyclo-ligase
MEYTYKNSGVDINLANATVKEIKAVLQHKVDGDFAALVEHPYLEDFYLCATTDGIGTKVLPLLQKNDYATIANDLIAMNLNDLACVGACPVLFLDYLAVNNLDKNICVEIVKELHSQLQKYHCSLVGGEIAELGSIIKEGVIDVSGFTLGLVEKKSYLGKHNVKEGDILIALESSGIHTNGFTLVNKLSQDGLLNSEEFLAPTKIYINEVLELKKRGLIKAAANITGGGILDNLRRIIPDNLCAQVEKESLPKSDLWEKLISLVGEKEAFSVFNMGCGMILVASKEAYNDIVDVAKIHNPHQIGVITNGQNSPVSIR